MDIYEALEPQRYSVDCGIVDTDGEGEYVLYSDYDKVRKHLETVLQKIANVAKAVGIYNGEVQLTGPHCIMFLEDFEQMIKAQSFTEEEATIEARKVFIANCFSPEVLKEPDFEYSRRQIDHGDYDHMPMLQITKAALLHQKEIPDV
jgi:hypothetical protein